MNKEEAIKQFKNYFPDGVEAIVLTKEDYDRQLGKLQYENIELEQEIKDLNDSITWYENRFNAVARDKAKLRKRIDKAIEYINTHSEMTDIQIYGIENTLYFRGSVDKLLNILKGEDNE